MIIVQPIRVKRALAPRVAKLGKRSHSLYIQSIMYGEAIILASESPRRAAILESLRIPFIKIIPSIDESVFDHLEPAARVSALAATKARRGALLWEKEKEKQLGARDTGSQGAADVSPRFVLGADTLVAFDTPDGWETIGKPADARDAEAMLRRERGMRQYVFSGICLLDIERNQPELALSVSEVKFAPMTDAEIAWYLGFDEWKGAAGAYRVQGVGSCFIEEIKGSFSGVMGLPIHELYGILEKSGYLASQQ